jgi:bifunctional DNase/RNase
MKFRVHQIGIVSIAIAISFLTVSCTSDKVSQCASMIKVVNQTVMDTKTTTESGTKGDVPTIEKLVEIFDKATKDLNSVSISDEKLKTYKSQFLTMYQGATEINKQLVASIKEKKSTKVHEGLRKSRNIFSPERDLATGLTQYCKATEK